MTKQPAAPNLRPPLDTEGVKRVQGIIGALFWYVCAVNKNVIADLSDIVYQQAAATESNSETIYHLLDYIATYLNEGIT